jgi:hypothetical protein
VGECPFDLSGMRHVCGRFRPCVQEYARLSPGETRPSGGGRRGRPHGKGAGMLVRRLIGVGACGVRPNPVRRSVARAPPPGSTAVGRAPGVDTPSVVEGGPPPRAGDGASGDGVGARGGPAGCAAGGARCVGSAQRGKPDLTSIDEKDNEITRVNANREGYSLNAIPQALGRSSCLYRPYH